MTTVLLALLHVAVIAAKLRGVWGVRAVMAENLLLRQQLLVLRRGRQHAPNLYPGRPGNVRVLVALPQSRPYPQSRRRAPPFLATGVSSGLGAAQEPAAILVNTTP